MHPAGYNVVIVESVGLGQSEVEIDNAVDMLVMIVPPGGGDGLQVRHCPHVHLPVFIFFVSVILPKIYFLCVVLFSLHIVQIFTFFSTVSSVSMLCEVMVYDVLYCTVLYCTVLYCTVLYCTVLYCTVQYSIVLNCVVLSNILFFFLTYL